MYRSTQKAYKRINTAYHRKKEIEDGNPEQPHNYLGSWLYIDIWKITESDIKDIVRYTFQWTVRKDWFSWRKLPAELLSALERFQKFFWDAFENGTLKHPIVVWDAFRSSTTDDKYLNLWWGKLYKDIMSSVTNITPPKATREEVEKHLIDAQRHSFTTWNYINHEMAKIEKALKDHTDKIRTITQDSESKPDSQKPKNEIPTEQYVGDSIENLKNNLNDDQK